MNTMLVHFGVDFEPIQRPNVHTEVIRPRFPQLQKEKRSIEVEIHVIISPSKIDASILFHKVRITAVLDLLLELKSFVFDDVPEEDVPKELCKCRQCSESITSGGTYELSRTLYSKNCGYYAVGLILFLCHLWGRQLFLGIPPFISVPGNLHILLMYVFQPSFL